jgi:hypothetical protein
MELTIVYDRINPTEKWIMKKSNIGKKYLCGIVNFKDDFNEATQFWLTHLTAKADKTRKETEWTNTSSKLPTDTFRELNMQEYIKLSNMLKKVGAKYNKKKDEFIENKHEIETII